MTQSKFCILFDTICTGFDAVMTEDANGQCRVPLTFDTEEEALAEIAEDEVFYTDCFVGTVDEIGHKTIYTGE